MKKRTASTDGSRDKKKARLDSRKIRVQNKDAALKDGILDIPSFLKTREYEIKQLHQTMENSKKSASKRAFQKVPRELRRRTASHNAKRVPKRLQKRALQEMTDTPEKSKNIGRGHKRAKHMSIEKNRTKDTLQNVKESGLSKEEYEMTLHNVDLVGCGGDRAAQPKGKFKFKSRQHEKVWLPTHVWHAKRAHMCSNWGYAVAQRPTQKCYRPTHRAVSAENGGAVAWDSSYFDCIVIHTDVENCLKSIGAETACGKRYKSGKRVWHGLLYADSNISIGPGTIYWSSSGDGDDDGSKVLLRIHPALFDELYNKIGKNGDDCRYAIGSIDITGPKSLSALRSILKPKDSHPLWNKLASISNLESLPDFALPLDVYDARLYSPKGFKVSKRDSENLTDTILELSSNTHKLTTTTGLLNSSARQESYNNQPSKKALDKRSIPGKDTVPVDTDPTIPTLLLKTNNNNTLTLLLPWHWVHHFWYQLMQVSNVRIGGLEQRHQIAFEQSQLFFPDDYIFTPTGQQINEQKIQQNKDKWEAKPPAKRVNYKKIGEIGNPFGCDWSLISSSKNGKLTVSYPTDEDEDMEKNDDFCKLMPVSLYVHGNPKNHARVFDQDNLVGFVTSGNYNLEQGFGTAIAWIKTTTNTEFTIRNVGSSTHRKATATKIIL